MVKEFVKYLDRDVPKDGFRVFIYGKNGEQKLVNSWDEFKKNVFSGEWFASKEEIPLLSKENFNLDEIRESQAIEIQKEPLEIEEQPVERRRGRPKANK